ncbi:MAG: nucleoside recognition domain-containing protein [Alphaproteobacteria bacterium]
MNVLFFILIALGCAVSAYRQLTWSGTGMAPMDQLASAMVGAAGEAVTLALGLIGIMALFLGFMKIGEAGGLLLGIARLLRPLMSRLFRDVPADHPAMGAMILNISASLLGLGNAATPFGLRAMQELERLNRHKGTASDAMVLFLAINTSGVTILPTTVIALRVAAGSADPAGIVLTTLVATLAATAVAILSAKVLAPLIPIGTASESRSEPAPLMPSAIIDADMLARLTPAPTWATIIAFAVLLGIVPAMLMAGNVLSTWLLPAVAVFFVGFGIVRRVRVYEVFVDGAKEGFEVAVRIIPYLVAILVAIGMVRASGAMDLLVKPLGQLTAYLGLPPEALTLAVLRSFSGSGAYGYLASLLRDPSIGPDSHLGYLVSTIQGSSETTFYVLAVYFGAVGIRRVRHALMVGIIGDVAGALFSASACGLLLAV